MPLIGSSVKKPSRKVGTVIHRVQTEDLSETSPKSPCIFISASMHPNVHKKKSALLRQRDVCSVHLRDEDRPVTLSMCGKRSTMTHCFSYVPDKEKANTSAV